MLLTASGGLTARPGMGKVQLKKVLGHMFDISSCSHVDAELALDANCHKHCIFAVLG